MPASSLIGKFHWPGWAAKDLLLIAAVGLLTLGSPWGPIRHLQSPASPATGSEEPRNVSGPSQESASAKDLDLARTLRQKLQSDSLASEVNVTVQDGLATLSGAVPSDEEQNSIRTKASQIVGNDNIIDKTYVVEKESPEESQN